MVTMIMLMMEMMMVNIAAASVCTLLYRRLHNQSTHWWFNICLFGATGGGRTTLSRLSKLRSVHLYCIVVDWVHTRRLEDDADTIEIPSSRFRSHPRISRELCHHFNFYKMSIGIYTNTVILVSVSLNVFPPLRAFLLSHVPLLLSLTIRLLPPEYGHNEGIYFCCSRTFARSHGSFVFALICFLNNHITVGELLFFSSSSIATVDTQHQSDRMARQTPRMF